MAQTPPLVTTTTGIIQGVTDGSVNATLPKDVGQEDLTLEKALELIAAKAAKGPAKKKRKAPAKKTAAKKKAPAKKKAAAKS